MSTAEIILRGDIAEHRTMLTNWRKPPVFITPEQDNSAKRMIQIHIREMELILKAGSTAIFDWWMALPEDVRHGLANA